MRILAIRGQNLASLAHSFEVDLVRGPLAGVGLFAITGPVGAGKSTLLDALCLPLFDQTPRLHGRGGPLVGDEAQDPNDWLRANDPRTLLRRDAAEGFAEVDFSGRDGVRYRARWSVRRARRRIDGRVQEQELSLRDLDRDLVVAAGRRSEVLLAVQQRLGLDFAQFCRSVLLAQGDFAAFLRAPADERARLLETLTGAEIYRRLSKAAHERARSAGIEVGKLQAQLDAQQVLADEQRHALERELARLRDEQRMAEVGIALASQHVQWHDDAANHRRRESDATVALQQAIARDQAAAEPKQRVAAQQRALAAVPRWQLAQEAEARADAAERDERAAVATLDERQRALVAAEARWHAAFARTFGVAPPSEWPPLLAELARWQPLVQQLQQAERHRHDLAATAPARAQAVMDSQTALATAQQQAVAAAADVERVRGELAAAQAAAQAWRSDTLQARRRELDAGRERLAAAQRLLEAWSRAAASAGRTRERAEAAAATAAELQAKLAAADGKHAHAVAAVQRVRSQLEALGQRAALAAFGAQLQPGAPCPLCGSAEHPAPVHHDDAELAVQKRACAAAERVLAEADAQLRLAATNAAAAQRDRQRAEEERQHAADELAAAQRAFEALAACREEELAGAQSWFAAATSAQALATAAFQHDEAAAAAVVQQLQQALAAAGEVERQQHARQQALVRADAALERAREADTQLVRDRAAAATRLDELLAALAPACAFLPEGVASLQRLSGDRLAALQALADELRRRNDIAAQLQAAQGARQLRGAAAIEAGQERERARQDLLRALAPDGLLLADVEAAARLGADGIAEIARQHRELENEVVRARAALAVIARDRQRHEAHAQPAMDADEAKRALADARTAAEQLQKRCDEAKARLGADDLVRKQRDELAPRLAAAQAAQGVWLQLDELIGSSNGDAFAVFAQELTLDLLLLEANRRLAELARRYRLQRNRGGELDFVVVDLDLGGQRRSLMTLSGGETFLVSLALALALATLAAPRSRVETLFLDEGFGTLDAQSLEQALGALDALQAAGCQVGIISHVDGIAERIGAQVVVQPEGAGQSRVLARVR
ncbi:MAG: AAA family ATPase [Planctomycetota bacterium]